jgi:hypothetical protein
MHLGTNILLLTTNVSTRKVVEGKQTFLTFSHAHIA